MIDDLRVIDFKLKNHINISRASRALTKKKKSKFYIYSSLHIQVDDDKQREACQWRSRALPAFSWLLIYIHTNVFT